MEKDRTDGAPHLYLFKGAEILLQGTEEYRLPGVGERERFSAALIAERSMDRALPEGDQWGELDASFCPPEGYALMGLREMSQRFGYKIFVRAGVAFQWMDFYRTNAFCSKCGSSMRDHRRDQALECPACAHSVYPLLAPAVIVAVQREGSLLLARSPHFQPNMMSIVAGFVEPGETLEQTVAREVLEETGIHVKNIRYFGSQPWPFPHSLMLGFTAEWESGEIQIDGVEIEAAGWYTPDTMPQRPSSVSIARMIIDDWLERQRVNSSSE